MKISCLHFRIFKFMKRGFLIFCKIFFKLRFTLNGLKFTLFVFLFDRAKGLVPSMRTRTKKMTLRNLTFDLLSSVAIFSVTTIIDNLLTPKFFIYSRTPPYPRADMVHRNAWLKETVDNHKPLFLHIF